MGTALFALPPLATGLVSCLYEIPKNDLVDDMKLWPPVTSLDVYDVYCYLIETPGDFTWKKLKAYNFVISGWVKPLRVLKRNSGYDSHDATSSSSFPHPPIRLRNDLYCVGWGVKLYSLTHSPSSDFCPSPCNEGLGISPWENVELKMFVGTF